MLTPTWDPAPCLFLLMNDCREVGELRRALAAGADAGALDAAGNTTLMWAATQALPEFVAELLPLVDPKVKNERGADALRIAAFRGDPRCVELLLAVGDIDGQEGPRLDWAVGEGWGSESEKSEIRRLIGAEGARREGESLEEVARQVVRSEGPRAL